jgi:hypothetical protein
MNQEIISSSSFSPSPFVSDGLDSDWIIVAPSEPSYSLLSVQTLSSCCQFPDVVVSYNSMKIHGLLTEICIQALEFENAIVNFILSKLQNFHF